ncbi:beta-ketoacyl-ACP synthase III [Deinococcus roseus]|uniref:Beta-ketoacyl-[acyl-carrier-protein] synthase III n=1 Tax=Deinococcus roseus TaxID=392414 RepID=A0ABQ2D2D4_9DEIO|nr:beta-ketoacyl-ACP synthase III [Deinococcus roseus]GGJ37030.1 3-oxoacyl-[acyl-carrier-protein] synthase 3 [Deinococcus roseus]
MNAGITALGTYVPTKVVTNADLEQRLDTSDEWIQSRTGIQKRHFAEEGEFCSTLAIRAVENLKARYGDHVLDGVDLVIVATATPDAMFPATASLVQAHFGLKAGAFDLLAACPGWLYAISAAQAYVASGTSKKVLAIGAETLSRVINWDDRATAVLFGDGAGAAIIEGVKEGYGFKSFVLGSDGMGADHLHMKAFADCLPSGARMTRKLYMNGREVFKFAVRVMDSASLEAIEKAGLKPENISLFVPHQANARIIDSARERLKLPPERVVVTVQDYGNNSAASVPLALQRALDEGRVQDGDHLLFVAFGAGLSWASCVLTWGGKQ